MLTTRADRLILLSLLALNALLKFSWLGVNELSLDEPFTVYWSQRPLPEVFEMLRTENNPPLYFLLIKAWAAIVGLDEALLRIPSALFSTLTVWPLWMIARRLGDRLIAVVACLLFTFSQYHCGLAHEVRAYALFCLLTVLSIWLCVQWTMDAGKRAWREDRTGIWALALVNAVMVYTHFFGWLAIGLQAACVAALPPGHRSWRRFAIGALGAVVASAPYMIVFIRRAYGTVREGTWVERARPEALYNMIWTWSNAPVIAVLFLASIAAMLLLRRGAGPLRMLALVWTFVPLIGLWVASQWVPMFVDRYLVFAAPGFALLVAVALCTLVKAGTWKQWIAPAIGVAGMAFTFTPWVQRNEHPSQVVAWTQEKAGGRMPVALTPAWYKLSYAWALDRELYRLPGPIDAALHERGVVPSMGEIGVNEGASPAPLVLVDAWGDRDVSSDLHRRLRATYSQVDSTQIDRYVRVYAYRP